MVFNMKKIFLFLILVCSILISQATIYYVDSSITDTNVGSATPDFTTYNPTTFSTSTGTASVYKSVDDINLKVFAGGDQLLFRKGQTWVGTYDIERDGTAVNFTIGSFGTGANPILTGFQTITSGWTEKPTGSGIYFKIVSSESAIQIVTIDGVQYGMGRYPNAGIYLSYESSTSNISITDTEGFGTTNWIGAEAVITKNGFTIDRCPITNQVGNVLTYVNNIGGTTRSANATGNYFIQNSKATLNQYGEWCYKSDSLFVFFGTTVNPTTKTVKAATKDYIIYDDSFEKYVVIDGLIIEGANKDALRFPSGNDYITIQNCTIKNIGGFAIKTSRTYTEVLNNAISYTGGGVYTNAAYTSDPSLSHITGNSFSYIGTTEGQVYKIVDAIVITSNEDGLIAQYNIIDHCGYMGIYFMDGKQGEIRNNLIKYAAQVIFDSGAIYINGVQTGTVIDNNIVDVSGGNGIYLDEKCDGAIVTDNSLFNCSLTGIYLNMAHNNTITGNISYNNNWQFGMSNWKALWVDNVNGNENNLYNNTVTGNTFVAKESTQGVLSWNDDYIGTFTLGTFNNNYYCRPILETTIINTNHATTTDRTLAGWKTFSGQDANTVASSKVTDNVNDLQYYYNATNAAVNITVPKKSMNMAGTVYKGTVSLPAYSSLVLITKPYYVSETGNDANDGLTLSTPWQTLNKVNATTFLGNDELLFKTGDEWYGTISLKPVTGIAADKRFYIGSYGTGINPTITGFKKVASWVNTSGNIWESADTITSLSTVNIVTVDGINKDMGREPEVGSVWEVDTHSGNTQITSTSIGASGINWSISSTAQLVKREVHWTWAVCDIVSQSGNTITYTNPYNSGFDTPYDDSGFFVQNDSLTLDTAGEWYFNPTTKKIRVYSVGQPVNVKASARNIGLKSTTGGNRSFVTVDGISFDGYNDYGFYMNDFDYVEVQNCTFNHMGFAGVFVQACDPYTINNNTIKNCAVNGIYATGTPISNNGTITNNSIDSTALVLHIGGSQFLRSGIGCSSDVCTIKNNTITNSGYHGIYTMSMNGLIEENFIDYPMMNRSDGGGIYTAVESSNLRINRNIILNSKGYALGDHGAYLGARGIYLDRQTSNISVTNNTTAFCWEGIYVSVGADHTIVSGNTSYGNTTSAISFNDDIVTYPTMYNQLNTLTNNVFIGVSSTDVVGRFKSKSNRIPSFLSVASNNVYARPIDDNLTFYVNQPSTGSDTASTSFTLAEWKAFIGGGKDATSIKSPFTISNTSDVAIIYNETNTSKIVTHPWNAKTIDGINIGTSSLMQPYDSKIIFYDIAINIQAYDKIRVGSNGRSYINRANGKNLITK